MITPSRVSETICQIRRVDGPGGHAEKQADMMPSGIMRIDVRLCRYARHDTSGKAAGDLIDRMAT